MSKIKIVRIPELKSRIKELESQLEQAKKDISQVAKHYEAFYTDSFQDFMCEIYKRHDDKENQQ